MLEPRGREVLELAMAVDGEDDLWCCEQWFPESQQKHHMNKYHQDPFEHCPICRYKTRDFDMLQKHFMISHKDDTEDVDMADPFEIEEIFMFAKNIDFSCKKDVLDVLTDELKKETTNSETQVPPNKVDNIIKEHLSEDIKPLPIETTVKCKECRSELSNKEELLHHVKSVHLPKEFKPKSNIQCEKCTFVAETRQMYIKHLVKFHDQQKFPCNSCRKVFIQKDGLERHKTTAHG